jgi:hypothetical protein
MDKVGRHVSLLLRFVFGIHQIIFLDLVEKGTIADLEEFGGLAAIPASFG